MSGFSGVSGTNAVISSSELYDENGGPYAVCEERLLPPPIEEDEVDIWYPTRRKAFEFANVAATIPTTLNVSVVIRETSFGCGKLGYCVWPASVVLGLLLVAHPDIVRGKRIMELGAGCGLPSSLCQRLGAEVVLATDFWDRTPSSTSPFVTSADSHRGSPIPARMHAQNLAYNTQGSVEWVDWQDLESVRSARDNFRPMLFWAVIWSIIR